MQIYVKGLSSAYEIEHLTRVFFPKAVPCSTYDGRKKADFVYARYGKYRMAVGLQIGGQVCWRWQKCDVLQNEAPKMALSRLLFSFLCEQTGQRPPWGMLTGVRPVRLLRNKIEELGELAAAEFLQEQYVIGESKLHLAKDVFSVQRPFLEMLSPRDISVYISIPFCPTRCSYCSFVSQSIEKEGSLLPVYLEKLQEELQLTSRIVKEYGLQLRCIYVGGGTPAVLSAKQLDWLLTVVQQTFDLSRLWEYTVEMGRADCTDLEKLLVLNAHQVGRVSVNPQSMTPAVLQAIGRNHGPQEVLRCVQEVRGAKIPVLNMDLIAGLPKETEESFAKSLQQTLSCMPENITLHTLTLKRASHLAQQEQQTSEAEGMLEMAYAQLRAAGYHPYYLYRQKNTPGNFENTGWSKKGYESAYNIYIMEEVQSILSVGAGGVTKLVFGQGAQIKRYFNDKVPLEYLRNFEKVRERKKEVGEVYAGILDSKTLGGSGVGEYSR